MVSVMLAVLKIAGISVLAILGLVLLILLLILFVPVRYRANGNFIGMGNRSAQVRAGWLLHIVSLKTDFVSGQAFHMIIKLFGIVIYDNLKTGSKKIKNKKRKPAKNKPKSAGELQAASVENDNAGEDKPDWGGNWSDEDDELLEKYIDEHIGKSDEDVGEKEKKTNIFQKIQSFFGKIANIFKNIKFTFQKICDTIVRMKNDIKYYLDIWQRESTQKAVAVCKEQLGWFWKRVKPKKFSLYLHIGCDDVEFMGGVLAVWGIFYPLHLGTIDICPEFDRYVFEGNFTMKGRANLYVFLKAAAVLYFDKDIRTLKKQFKQK